VARSTHESNNHNNTSLALVSQTLDSSSAVIVILHTKVTMSATCNAYNRKLIYKQ